jgi:hypothetical protein
MSVTYTAAGLGIAIAGSILWLVRRDHLHGSHALWWLMVAGGALVAGFAPAVVDWLGKLLGVHYPPMLLVVVVLGALLLKLLQVDIDTSRRERRMRRMIQKMAILELEVRELREQLEASRTAQRPVSSSPLTPTPTAADPATGLRKVVG